MDIELVQLRRTGVFAMGGGDELLRLAIALLHQIQRIIIPHLVAFRSWARNISNNRVFSIYKFTESC